jgi:hypothetical protein
LAVKFSTAKVSSHSIFGTIVVGGMETLSAMERISTDNKVRPVEDITIESAWIFTDPYAEVDEKVTVTLKSIQS